MSQILGPAITKKKLFIVGLVAGAIAVAVSLLMRLLAGGSFLPEIVKERFFLSSTIDIMENGFYAFIIL